MEKKKKKSFCPLSRLLAVGDAFGEVKIYGSSVCYRVPLQGSGVVSFVAFVPGKHKLIVVFGGKYCEVVNLVSGTSLCVRELPEKVASICAVCNRNYVFLGTDTGKLIVLNLENEVFVSQYAVFPESMGLKGRVRDVLKVICVAPDDEGVLLLGLQRSGTLVEWNLREGRVVNVYMGSRGLEAAAFKRDGKMIVAGYDDGSILLFNRKEPTKVAKSYFSNGANRSVMALHWSEKGGSNIILAVGCTPKDHPEGVTALLGSPLSRALAIAADNVSSAFFFDPSPHLSDVDPPAFALVTGNGKVLAFDSTSLAPIPLPAWFCPSSESIERMCVSAEVFSREELNNKFRDSSIVAELSSCSLLSGPTAKEASMSSSIVFKFVNGEVSLVDERDVPLSTIKSFLSGVEPAAKPLPSACVNMKMLPNMSIAIVCETELIVLGMNRKQLQYMYRPLGEAATLVQPAVEQHPPVPNTWSTKIHYCAKKIRDVVGFKDMLMVLTEDSVVIWKESPEGIVSEVSCNSILFDEIDDCAMGITVSSAHALLREDDDPKPLQVVQILVFTRHRGIWCLELHEKGCRFRFLGKLAKKERCEEPVVSMRVVSSNDSGDSTDHPHQYLVVVESTKSFVRRLHGSFDETCVLPTDAGWINRQALFLPFGQHAGVFILQVREDEIEARIVVLPLVDVTKGILGTAVLYNNNPGHGGTFSQCRRFYGGLGKTQYSFTGRAVFVVTSFGELLRFNVHVSGGGGVVVVQKEEPKPEETKQEEKKEDEPQKQEQLLQQQQEQQQQQEPKQVTSSLPPSSPSPPPPKQEDEFHDDHDVDPPTSMCLSPPDAKVKEKPKGWLGGLFGSNNDDIASLFVERLTSTKQAAATSNAHERIDDVRATMEENKRKLAERGEHLNEVGDRAEQLENQTNQFRANIAKLRAKQENKLFGIF